jgi:MFS family permease
LDGARLDRRALGVLAPSAPEQTARAASSATSAASARGLDWFTFFLADIQTGFGPFIAIYLTARHWAQFDIGLVLTVGGLVALAAQMPGGALVDAIRSARTVAAVAVAAICLSALALAIWPTFPVVMGTRVVHAAASCVLGPVIAALSLRLVGYTALGERLGRNARFASLGNGIAAAAMGALGYFFSAHAVFFVTAALLIPTLFALSHVQPHEINVQLAHGGDSSGKAGKSRTDFRLLLRQRPLFLLAGCIALFHLANAAMLPLMGSVLTTRSGAWATVLIAACIVVPQGVVALISPWVGRQAEIWGRRVFLLAAFTALALRGILFATVADPAALVVVQLLDGITAASLGVMVPLMIADISRGTGHFSFAQGIVGTAVGIGASISPTLAGYLSDQFGSHVAFFGLAGIATV